MTDEVSWRPRLLGKDELNWDMALNNNVASVRHFDQAYLLSILNELNSPMGLQASLDTLFRDAVFGRDALRVGLGVLERLPSLAEQIVFCLAALQSTQSDSVSDAKGPGQIPHEYRFLFNGPRMIAPHASVAFDYAKSDDCMASHPTIVGTNRPQPDQAWTVSFVFRELPNLRLDESAPDSKGWQVDLTREIRSNFEAGENRAPARLPRNEAAYCVDIEKGIELERPVLSTT